MQCPVLVQRVVVVAIGSRIDGAVPLRPAGRDLGLVLRPVAVQVLAEMDSEVAAVLQPDRERVGRVELVVAAVRRRIPAHTVVVGVLTRQQARARGAAERKRVEVVVEGDALGADQATHVRQDVHLGECLVIGLEDEDVRALPRRRARVPM